MERGILTRLGEMVALLSRLRDLTGMLGFASSAQLCMVISAQQQECSLCDILCAMNANGLTPAEISVRGRFGSLGGKEALLYSGRGQRCIQIVWIKTRIAALGHCKGKIRSVEPDTRGAPGDRPE